MSGATYRSGPEMTPAGDIVTVERAVSVPGSIAALTQGWRDDMLAQHKRVAAIYEERGTSAVKKAQPLRQGDVVEKRRETVPASCTLNERDAVIVTIEGPRVTRYKVQCRSASTTEDGSRYMDTRHTAWFTAYLKAYDAAEAWAYRGEVPKGDAE